MPTKPKAKKKRGIVVEVRRYGGISIMHEVAFDDADYVELRRAGLPELKPGESVKVRVLIEAI